MGQYLWWLADAARMTGYPVTEMRGWRGHNHGPMAGHVYGTVCHHTAGAEPPRSSDFPSINVVRNGRAGLPGPLSQYGLGFSGRIYVISDGLAYHAGSGGWRGVSGNSRMIGIEAEDSGDGDWTSEQLDCYSRLVAAIQDYLGEAQGWVCGHKEWTDRKIDPAGIHMPDFRGEVAHYLNNPHLLRRGSTAEPREPGVVGEIRHVYEATPGLKELLGEPVTPELPTADGKGRFNRFEFNRGKPAQGHIYWYPGLGAHATYGAIQAKYGESKWERGPLGYPTSHEFGFSHFDRKGEPVEYRQVNFQHGYIIWNPDMGAVAHH